MIAPDDLKDSEEVVFEFRVTPMNNETPFADEYVQQFSFPYMTECSGAACLFQELINPEPQTIAFYVLIVALLFYARGRSGRAPADYDKDDFLSSEVKRWRTMNPKRTMICPPRFSLKTRRTTTLNSSKNSTICDTETIAPGLLLAIQVERCMNSVPFPL